MSESQVDRQSPLRCTDVRKGLVFLPRKLPRESLASTQTDADHGCKEVLHSRRIAIESLVTSLAGAHFALRQASAQRRRQPAPKGIQPRVGLSSMPPI